MPRLPHRGVVLSALAFIVFNPVARTSAQPPAAPVLYTEAREHAIRSTVQLPGTVEARVEGPVSTEVEGLVDRILAREGTRVDRGAPLVKLRETNLQLSLRASQAELKEAEARLSAAERALRRAQELVKSDLLSEGEFDDTEADFLSWQGRTEKLAADIERIELDIRRCTIRSSIAGVVTAEHVEVGAWIQVGDPVVDVLSTEELDVRVEVPDRYFPQMRRDVPVSVAFSTVPPIVIDGTVSAVIPMADTRSRVFPVKVSLSGSNVDQVAVGMLAQVNIPVGEAVRAIIVPKDALVPQGPQTVVFVLGDDGSATAVPVVSGQGAGAWVAVTGEITPGMKVIVRGNERVFPGQTFQGEALEYPLP